MGYAMFFCVGQIYNDVDFSFIWVCFFEVKLMIKGYQRLKPSKGMECSQYLMNRKKGFLLGKDTLRLLDI